MHIDIVTALPGLLDSFVNQSILRRAQDKKLVELMIRDLRAWSPYKHKQVDDYAYGGGAGMVLMVEPLSICIEELRKEREFEEIIYMTPDGEPFTQKLANRLSLCRNIMIICGHYKGIDERIRQNYITREISIGDYVLSGGEIPAAVVTDAVIRLIPGVLSDETSALSDSFQDDLLAPPVYSRPAEFNGWKVPEVLLSGNESEIEKWRYEQALERTRERRPGLYKRLKNIE